MDDITKLEWFETNSAEETYKAGEQLGINAKPGEVYTLYGDLGAGKTVFTQGLAAGLGIQDQVCSPTFTILQIYEKGRIPLYHFDVYRIADVEEMYEIGCEEYFYGDGVCVIEWAERITELIPKTAQKIIIQKNLDKGFDYRKIQIQEWMQSTKQGGWK